MNYLLHFLDGDRTNPILVNDAVFLPRNGDLLYLQTEDDTTKYTPWVVDSVAHNVMASFQGHVAAPPNVYVHMRKLR